jgi:hypothetical protein
MISFKRKKRNWLVAGGELRAKRERFHLMGEIITVYQREFSREKKTNNIGKRGELSCSHDFEVYGDGMLSPRHQELGH